jgi:hypothetical protein
LPYDVIKDFAPLSMMVSAPLVLAVNPDVKANTAAEFLALVKSKPGELSFGSAGNGTSMHLTGEMYKQAADVSMVHVPYRGGGGLPTRTPDASSCRFSLAARIWYRVIPTNGNPIVGSMHVQQDVCRNSH